MSHSIITGEIFHGIKKAEFKSGSWGKRSWVIKLEDGDHRIELEHGYVSGKRVIYLDGNMIEHIRFNVFDTGSIHEFRINAHICKVLITSKGFVFSYDLTVDGISVKTGLPVETTDDVRAQKDDYWAQITALIAADFSYVVLSSFNIRVMPALLICFFIYLIFLFGIKALISRLRAR